jgi:hypothetical protein
MPALMAAGVTLGIGLALLLVLFVSAGVARAIPAEHCVPEDPDFCAGESQTCWGPELVPIFGCDRITIRMANPIGCFLCFDAGPTAHPRNGDPNCETIYTCVEALVKQPSVAVWLADVCEPNDGFSADGGMTWDSGYPGPLEFAASMEGPWYEVEVNGPPWVVTEENMESFAAMVGVEDWHDMWVRSGEGYPRHVGNTVMERDARMGALCAE